MKAKVISGFPGVGKSYSYEKLKTKLTVLDSDSSKFDKSKFPHNYIEHIKENLDSADIIFVSSHNIVREALVEAGIKFYLVYPDAYLQDEYIERYVGRDNDPNFINLVKDNWFNWITELEHQRGCVHCQLEAGQYMADFLDGRLFAGSSTVLLFKECWAEFFNSKSDLHPSLQVAYEDDIDEFIEILNTKLIESLL